MSIKKFNNFINEGVKQYLKPKPEDEIVELSFKKLKKIKNPYDKLNFICNKKINNIIPKEYLENIVNEIINDNENPYTEKYKNFLKTSQNYRNFILIINLDNYNIIDIGLYASKEVWKSIKNLI